MAPRIARLELPGVPMHVIQRGVNRCAVFHDDLDRLHYRKLLRIACGEAAVAIHAYVLLANHVHLLLSANVDGSISRAIARIGQADAPNFDLQHNRTGPLSQGRSKSSFVQSEADWP